MLFVELTCKANEFESKLTSNFLFISDFQNNINKYLSASVNKDHLYTV